MISPGVVINLNGTTVISIPTPIKPDSLMATIVVYTTHTQMCAIDNTNLAGRTSLTLQNNSLNAIYLGNTIAVSKDNGVILASGSSMTFDFDPTVDTNIYGITLGIPSNVSVIEA